LGWSGLAMATRFVFAIATGQESVLFVG
jgi:hypothetical protein